ncbi:MAG: hypothetical protein COA95_08395 [Methylophaga sp.]|nr:MAG: hypothetical protein COA95_08395 [Methylophaga sp.]
MGNLIMNIKNIKIQLQKLNISVLLLTSLFFSNAVLAIDIAQSPLFIDKSATPNVMFILDDSGSMDWEVLAVPHWKAQNYDHDVMRYWARGGWVGWSDTPTSEVVDATWSSYTGYCYDKNADGVCFNELYLNDDNDRNDSERTFIAPIAANDDWRLILQHLYFWEYPVGYCQAAPTPPTPPTPPSGANAINWLPNMEGIFTFLTQSKNIFAHTGDFGPSSSPWQWNGGNHPNAQDTGGGAYYRETWSNVGPELDTWRTTFDNKALKKTCEDDGDTWKKNTSTKFRILHHAPHANRPLWVNGWSGAVTVNPLTGAITANGPLNSRTGEYHNEYLQNYTTTTSGRARFDINGDGIGNDGSYNEKDSTTEYRSANYRYIQHLTDNIYYKSDEKACRGQESPMKYYTAVNKCMVPNSYMPRNYPASTETAIDNPSNKVAKSEENPGKLDFIQLADPAVVPRYIRSDDWVGTPRTPNVDVTMPTWAADTKHGMSKHDPFPLLVDWRARSADFNVLYYSPNSQYSVWPNITEVLPSGCSNKFNCARSNPQSGTAGYSLTTDLARPRTEYGAVDASPESVQAGFVYEVWLDDAGTLPSRTRPEWRLGDSKCGGSGGYTITAADVAASYNAAGVVDPATGTAHAAGQHVCFSYLNLNPDGSAGDGVVDLWDSHYRVEVKDSEIIVQKVRRTPHLKGEPLYTDTVYNRSSHYYWDADDKLGAAGNGSTVFTGTELSGMRVAMSDTRVLDSWDTTAIYADTALCIKVLGKDKDNAASCRPLSQIQENTANWYQYSRKRSFVAKGAIANLIAEIPDVNYGLMGTKKRSGNNISVLFKDIFDGAGSGNGDTDRTVHNNNIRNSMYSYAWSATGTPLLLALERAGEYFAGRGPNLGAGTNNHSTSPITESCQKNYAIMLTDGYWNGSGPGISNVDGDAYTDTLADVAKKYYDEDLSSLANEVPTDGFDLNNKQHLTTIGIGFGVSGSLVDDPDLTDLIAADGWPGNPDASGASVLTESSTWGGDPNSTNAYKIDDLWHAAYNSRGKYYKADNPEQLILQLKEAILTALAASGSASSLSANSTILTNSTRVYQTIFTSGEWTGDVKSYTLTSSGIFIEPAEWSAQGQLDVLAPGSRNIFTLDASGAGKPFTWAGLSDSQKILLSTRFTPNIVENVAFGQAQLNYIRGQDDVQFRARTHTLGDIVHSEPTYVGTPRQLYPDSWYTANYSDFRATHSARDSMLYVGANDGMLHAFDAATGAEKYAYIPRVLLPDLNALAHKPSAGQGFNHRYYVDDAPATGDVHYSGAWHSVLVGGLRGGGKGIYALDVTTVPSGESESTIAEHKGMWEFTSTDDVDMGYSFSKPSIVRLNNGSWAAIFGNGYNSVNGKAVLYIVEFNSSSSYGTVHKFDTGVGSGTLNGMSTPTVIDTNGDMIADRIYAGDLRGNVWNIDISDVASSNWDFSYGYVSAGIAKPMFTATDGSSGLQPITVPIVVSEHPSGPLAGYILNFGTGRYIGTSDNTDTGQVTQTMYGLWDYGSSSSGITRADLLSQEILADIVHTTSGTSVRVTSANGPINWLVAGYSIGVPGWQSHVDNKGWRLDLIDSSASPLDNKGERVVSAMVVRGDALILSTLLPAADPCDGGGSGWTLSLNAATGSRFSETPFDIDGDGKFSVNDFSDWTDSSGDAQSTAVSGVKSDSGIPSTPIILSLPGGGSVALSDRSSGELPTITGADTFGSAKCVIYGGGTCAVVVASNGEVSCTTTGGAGAYCEIGGRCAGGSCPLNGSSNLGRQSWIQLE